MGERFERLKYSVVSTSDGQNHYVVYHVDSLDKGTRGVIFHNFEADLDKAKLVAEALTVLQDSKAEEPSSERG